MSVENDPLVGTLRPRPGAVDAADVTLTLTDSLDISTVARFIESVAHAIAGGQRRVVADLRRVEFCDVSGLNALLWAHRRLTAEGGCLIITAPPRSLRRMLDILHLHQQLDVRGYLPPRIRTPRSTATFQSQRLRVSRMVWGSGTTRPPRRCPGPDR